MEKIEIQRAIEKNVIYFNNSYQFNPKQSYEDSIPVSFIRKTHNFSYEVSLSINKIGVYYFDNFCCHEFHTEIYFKQINDIINKLLVKHDIITQLRADNDRTLLLKKIEPNLYAQALNPTYPKVIENEQDVIDLLQDLNTYTQQVAEPFFEKWSDLRALNEFLDKCPQMETETYVYNGVFLKLLVYKLCNNPKYTEYFNLLYNFYINRYKENPTGDEVYKQTHDFMIDFKEILDKTEAVYGV